MKEKLKAHFLRFGPRRYVIFTVLSLVITDLLNTWFLKLYWQGKEMSLRLLQMSFSSKGMSLGEFSEASLKEMVTFIDNSFYFFLFIILLNNLFFYLFYLRRKLWAQGYILFYALTGAVLQLSFVFDRGGVSSGWLAYNLLTVPYYVYLFFGVKYLKAETTDVPPARGKMAQ